MTDPMLASLHAFIERFQGPNGAIAVARRTLQLTQFGNSLGLTDQEVNEVLDAWIAWYEHTPHPFSWDRVAEAVWDRFNGRPWQPGTR